MSDELVMDKEVREEWPVCTTSAFHLQMEQFSIYSIKGMCLGILDDGHDRVPWQNWESEGEAEDIEQ